MPQDKPTYGPDTAKALARIQTWIACADTAKTLDLRGLDIHTMPPLPHELHHLYCGDGPLVSIPLFPPALISLTIWACDVTFLPTLPPKLLVLHCENIPLKEIWGPFPPGLVYIQLPHRPIRITT